MKNQPLTSAQVKSLPLGYNITGRHANKYARSFKRLRKSSTPAKDEVQFVKGGFDKAGKQVIPMWLKVWKDLNSEELIWVYSVPVFSVKRVKIIYHDKSLRYFSTYQS